MDVIQMLDPLYHAMAYLIAMPFLAIVPAVLSALLYRVRKQKLLLITALAWLGYGIYETGMYLRILCGGECNIRVDLLVIYPLLAGLTLVALARLGWRIARG